MILLLMPLGARLSELLSNVPQATFGGAPVSQGGSPGGTIAPPVPE